MINDAVEYGLCPWGSPAILFQHHRGHSLLKGLQVEAISLPVCSALGEFFSEKSSLAMLCSGATVWILTAQCHKLS